MPILKIFLESIYIMIFGILLGFCANCFRENSLQINRNYYPRKTKTSSQATSPRLSTTPKGSTDELTLISLDPVITRLKENGLQPILYEKVIEIIEDPLYQDSLYLLIDARDEEHYMNGHIPGAYHMDYYFIENYTDSMMEVCLSAEKIVVYCSGGDCEDSELAAIELLGRGINPKKLFVYLGGITEWEEKNNLIEIGEQHSGNLQEPSHE